MAIKYKMKIRSVVRSDGSRYISSNDLRIYLLSNSASLISNGGEDIIRGKVLLEIAEMVHDLDA